VKIWAPLCFLEMGLMGRMGPMGRVAGWVGRLGTMAQEGDRVEGNGDGELAIDTESGLFQGDAPQLSAGGDEQRF
jgi:hypothetical protein